MIRAEPANADILNISDAILPDGGRGTRIELRDGRVLYVTRTKLRTSAATAKRKREARERGRYVELNYLHGYTIEHFCPPHPDSWGESQRRSNLNWVLAAIALCIICLVPYGIFRYLRSI